MWIPEQLILRKFLSHENTTFVFNQGVATMVCGINEDNEGQESNGSGKSGIIEGIAVAVTGDPFRKVNMADMIMDDEVFAEVHFKQRNTITKEVMEIERRFHRAKHKSAEVTIKINTVTKTNLVDTNEKNRFILDKMDIPKEDLINYFIVSKDKYTSFFNTGDTKKKEIVARFSGADMINGVEKLIEADVTKIVRDIDVLDRERVAVRSKIEVYADQVDELEDFDFDADQKKRIESMKQQIEDQKKTIQSLENGILEDRKRKKDSEGKISLVQKQLDNFKDLNYSKEIAKLEEEGKKINESYSLSKKELDEAEDLFATAQRAVKGSVRCPKCQHEFSLTDKDVNIKEAREVMSEVQEMITELEDEIVTFRENGKKTHKEIEGYQKKLQQHEQAKTDITRQINSLKRQLDTIESEIQSKTNRIKNYEDSIESCDIKIKLIKEEKQDEEKITNLIKKIGELQENVSKLDKQIVEKEDEKFKVEQWIYRFKKFHSHLANKAIKSIESYTNYYLDRIKSDLNIKLDGFKMKADGKMSEKISATVLRNGLEKGLFDKFSGGEKVRIDVCCILALQKLVNLNSKSGGFDFLALDEIIESVDGLGSESIMYALNDLNQTIEVITHTNFSKNYPHNITVRKKNDISEIL